MTTPTTDLRERLVADFLPAPADAQRLTQIALAAFREHLTAPETVERVARAIWFWMGDDDEIVGVPDWDGANEDERDAARDLARAALAAVMAPETEA